MFDSRYGHAINQARVDLAGAVAPASESIVALLHDLPAIIRGSGESGALLPLLDHLGEHQAVIRAAVDRYPLTLAVDTDGRPDPVGRELARLLATVEYVRVFYRNLTGIPEHLRGQAHRDLDGLARDANSVLVVLGNALGQ